MSYCCLSAVLLLLTYGFCCPHAQVLRKYGLLGEEEVDALEALGEAVQLAQLTAAQEEEMLGDVPDDFLVRSLRFAADCTHCHFWDPGAPHGQQLSAVSPSHVKIRKRFESLPGFRIFFNSIQIGHAAEAAKPAPAKLDTQQQCNGTATCAMVTDNADATSQDPVTFELMVDPVLLPRGCVWHRVFFSWRGRVCDWHSFETSDANKHCPSGSTSICRSRAFPATANSCSRRLASVCVCPRDVVKTAHEVRASSCSQRRR